MSALSISIRRCSSCNICRGEGDSAGGWEDDHVDQGHRGEEQGDRGGELPLPKRRAVEHGQSQALTCDLAALKQIDSEKIFFS